MQKKSNNNNNKKQRYQFLSVCAIFSRVQTMVWLLMFGIVTVRTDVDVWDCVRGLYRHRCESALGVDSRRNLNPLPHRGLEPPSYQYCAWIFSRALYQRSYPRPQHPCSSWKGATPSGPACCLRCGFDRSPSSAEDTGYTHS